MTEETELMTWGRKVEPLLIDSFLEDMAAAEEVGWSATPSGLMYRSTKPGREIMLATLDGTAVDPAGRLGIIECKLKIFGAQEWERHGIPDYVVAQAQHAMDVTDASFAVVIALLGGFRPRWKIVERDDELLGDVIVPAELAWWEKYLAGEAFPIDVGPADVNLELVRRLYPEDPGKTVKLKGAHLVEVATRWRAHAADRLAAEKLEKAAKVVLLEAIGPATYGVLDNGTQLSLKTQKRPEMLTKAATFRVLRETKPKSTGRKR